MSEPSTEKERERETQTQKYTHPNTKWAFLVNKQQFSLEIEYKLLFTRQFQAQSMCESIDICRLYSSGFSSIQMKYRPCILASAMMWC